MPVPYYKLKKFDCTLSRVTLVINLTAFEHNRDKNALLFPKPSTTTFYPTVYKFPQYNGLQCPNVQLPQCAGEQRICLQPRSSQACRKRRLKKGEGRVLCFTLYVKNRIVIVSLLHAVHILSTIHTHASSVYNVLYLETL